MVFAAAAVEFTHDGDATSASAHVALGLLAFSSGMQVAMVRGQRITDITTAMVTAVYTDVFIDPDLFCRPTENRTRNRRLAFLVSLVVGSFVGAIALRKVSNAFGLLLSALIKLIVTASLLFIRSAVEPGVGR